MGVKGLMQLLRQQRVPQVEEVLTPGQTLVIDVSGFLFYVLRHFDTSKTIRMGNYGELHKVLVEEIELIRSCNLGVICVFDGPSKMKTRISEQRDLEREQEWANLVDICSNCEISSNKSIPLPPLAFLQLNHTLQSLGVTTFSSPSEADQFIARICSSMNAKSGKEKYICYGEDSDFIAMEDTPYVMFDDLVIDHRSLTARAKHIWRRKHTAEALCMNQDRFVELCIYLGNDFVPPASNDEENEIDRLKFMLGGYSSPSSSSSSVPTIAAYKKFIEKDPSFFNSSSNTKIQQCIDFSRLFYGLAALDDYQDSDRGTLQDSYNLTKRQKEECRKIITEGGKIQWKSMLIRTAPICSVITEDQLEGLKRMISQLERKRNKDNDEYDDKKANETDSAKLILNTPLSCLPTRLKNVPPSWEDMLAAHYYQLLFKQWYVLKSKEVSEKGKENGEELNTPPMYYFDMNVYKACLKEVRQEKQDKNQGQKRETNSQVDEGGGALAPSLPTTRHIHIQNLFQLNPTGLNDLQQNQQNLPPQTPAEARATVLPIDAHRERILKKMETDRLVIIHGETGCGKSSRLPMFIYENAVEQGHQVKIAVTQPRRIAATNLHRRLNDLYGDKVCGLRLGGGVREGEDNPITFMTTGKLLRYFVADNVLLSYTHIVIDEVHERSVDSDVCCYFARELLSRHPTLRVVLMSATIHSDLYQDYFSSTGDGYMNSEYGDMEMLSVGVRRFPLKIFYAEDLVERAPRKANALVESTARIVNVGDIIPPKVVKAQYDLAEYILSDKQCVGTGVLVFVSGMADIMALNEMLEKANQSPSSFEKYKIFVIHSDVPLEEQQEAFQPADPTKVKVVLATNAAESSITIPDVDIVICLGTSKSIQYNEKTHLSQIMNGWISKASAKQRAGRTGRVRPGVVYRLYSAELHERFIEHDSSEIQRTPLQETIIQLKSVTEKNESVQSSNSVVNILESLIEPPDLMNINKSFEILHDSGMISDASDEGRLTPLGRFSSGLSVGIQLSKLIALGVALGVGEEATILASALSQQRPVFMNASPYVLKDPDELNSWIVKAFRGALYFDAGAYSEPIMLLRAFMEYESTVEVSQRSQWMHKHGLAQTRFKYFHTSTRELLTRVHKAMTRKAMSGGGNRYIPREASQYNLADLNNSKINLLRLILTWSSDGQIVKFKASPSTTRDNEVIISSPELTEKHLKDLIPKDIQWILEKNEPKGNEFSARLPDYVLEEMTPGAIVANVVTWLMQKSWTSPGDISDYLQYFTLQITLSSENPLVMVVVPTDARNKQVKLSNTYLAEITQVNKWKEEFFNINNGKTFHAYTFDGQLNKTKRANIKKGSPNFPSSMSISIDPPSMTMQLIDIPDAKDNVHELFLNYGDESKRLPKGEFHLMCKGIGGRSPNMARSLTFIDDKDSGDTERCRLFINDLDSEYEYSYCSDSDGDSSDSGYHTLFAPPVRKDVAHHALVDDIPVGVRLLTAIKNTCSGKKIVLWKDRETVSIENKNSKLVPGSAEYIATKVREAAGNNNKLTQADQFQVQMNCRSSSLIYFNDFIPGQVGRAMTGKYTSMPALVYPTKTQTLYGVCASAVEYARGVGEKLFVTEGVTLLPANTKWLNLARACMGLGKSKNIPVIPKDAMSVQEQELCDTIYHLLTEGIERDVYQNDEAIDLLSLVFEEWVTELSPSELEIVKANQPETRKCANGVAVTAAAKALEIQAQTKKKGLSAHSNESDYAESSGGGGKPLQQQKSKNNSATKDTFTDGPVSIDIKETAPVRRIVLKRETAVVATSAEEEEQEQEQEQEQDKALEEENKSLTRRQRKNLKKRLNKQLEEAEECLEDGISNNNGDDIVSSDANHESSNAFNECKDKKEDEQDEEQDKDEEFDEAVFASTTKRVNEAQQVNKQIIERLVRSGTKNKISSLNSFIVFVHTLVGSQFRLLLWELQADLNWSESSKDLVLVLEASGWYYVLASKEEEWICSRANFDLDCAASTDSFFSSIRKTNLLKQAHMVSLVAHAPMFSKDEQFFLWAVEILLGYDGCTLKKIVEGLSWNTKEKKLKSVLTATKRYIFQGDVVKRKERFTALSVAFFKNVPLVETDTLIEKVAPSALDKMIRTGTSGAYRHRAEFAERVKVIMIEEQRTRIRNLGADAHDDFSVRLNTLKYTLKWKNTPSSDPGIRDMLRLRGTNGSLKLVLEQLEIFELNLDETLVLIKPEAREEVETSIGKLSENSEPEHTPEIPSKIIAKKISYFHKTEKSSINNPNSTKSDSTQPQTVFTCKICGSDADKRCTGCSAVYYCGRECQAKDWKEHKLLCADMKSKKIVEDGLMAHVRNAHDCGDEKRGIGGIEPKDETNSDFVQVEQTLFNPYHYKTELMEEEGEEEEEEEEEKPGEHGVAFDEYSSDPDTTLPMCAFCGRLKVSVSAKNLLKCTGCRKVYYCSREHQKSHWKAHKYVCGKGNEHTSVNPVPFPQNASDGRMNAVTLDLTNII